MSELRLNLGCGSDKRPGFVNVDVDRAVAPDVVWDLNRIPYPFEDSSVSYVLCLQTYEHLTVHSIDFFREIYRLLRSDGILDVTYPNMYSGANRVRYVLGRIDESPEWNPHHLKLVHPRYVLALLRHIGFAPELRYARGPTFPFRYLLAGSVRIVARKRR